jgi:hypothetical protein
MQQLRNKPMQSGWRQSTAPVNSPVFSCLPRRISSSKITEIVPHLIYFAFILMMEFSNYLQQNKQTHKKKGAVRPIRISVCAM